MIQRRTKHKQIEAQDQCALIKWAQHVKIVRDYLIAIPNGGSRNVIEAANLKRQGVRKGVSDLFLAYPCNGFHGLWIELKREKGSNHAKGVVKKEQKLWLENMLAVGYEAKICYGWLSAKHEILNYLNENIKTT